MNWTDNGGTRMDFSITVKPTFEEYKSFNRVVHNKLGRQTIRIAVMMLLLAIDAYLFWAEFYLFAAIYLIVCAGVVSLAFLRANRNIKKAWSTNAALREGEMQLHFSNDGIEATSQNGYSHIDYDKLYKLIETKTHFYVLTASNVGFGFAKELCTSEQQAFIRERCTK